LSSHQSLVQYWKLTAEQHDDEQQVEERLDVRGGRTGGRTGKGPLGNGADVRWREG
jgi:hypothetical protein